MRKQPLITSPSNEGDCDLAAWKDRLRGEGERCRTFHGLEINPPTHYRRSGIAFLEFVPKIFPPQANPSLTCR
jgi:hypothetical protein